MQGTRVAGVIATALLATGIARASDTGWSYYGGDQGGQRYSAAAQITPSNVTGLKPAWTFSTHDLATKGDAVRHAS